MRDKEENEANGKSVRIIAGEALKSEVAKGESWFLLYVERDERWEM